MNHGDVGTKLYNTWRGMLNRVNNKSYIDSHRYISRGIDVYEPWRKYVVFREWALNNGYQEGLQIDRRDNDKGYHPDNCRFVDQFTNMNNREVTFYVSYNGVKISLKEILRKINQSDKYFTIRSRILRGWKADKAINTPVKKGNYNYGNRWKAVESL